MERRSVSDLQQHFQKILRDAEGDKELVITHAEETEGSKLGDNYMSIVLRTKVTGIRGNGEVYSGSFMTKHYPRHRAIAQVMRNADLFINEAYVYNQILPQLGDIAPRCVFADENEIVLADLKDEGYMVMPRLELLDLEHCKAVVQCLAKMHARSYALKRKDPKKFEELMSSTIEAVFPQDDAPCMGSSMDVSINTAINHLESLEDTSDELRSAIEFVKSLIGKSVEIMKTLVLPGQGKYDVLSHGDAWNNNILFKHDAGGHVVDVKLIDYQIPRHVSAAIDFHYLMYSSAKAAVIDENYDEIIRSYHSALVHHLGKCNVPEGDVKGMSIDWFRNELQKHHMYGLLTTFWLVNAVLAEENETVNLDDFSADFLEEIEKFTPVVTRKKAERIRFVVLHCIKRYRSKETVGK
uniref:RNF166_0 protein n=2 Tax=Fopius arisanus TaxID=64838 RepID=A0A0C9PQD2_9HYME